ncbi:MAG: hypothetical protein DMF95_16900 [Acidobacteria bacterium]|nr:MAG: hypothetical protein DMF96_01515 [Acidobacteriota bacterium]PYR16275.1 MAG: hypothetical protein DMF94_28565 [Acidobacteriota bacterium]PYR47238.1 MAG: hypothetical protein DMF95_16900 [Acidobacteriota bacterium]
MFITKKHIPRRTFLRGAGTMLALPLLDAMVPARTLLAQTAANPRTRFTGIFVPHGMAPGYWVPAKEGAGFEFPMILSPLEPFRDRTVVLSGLWSKSAEPPPGVTGADHWVAAAYLCADKPRKTAGADIYDGTTIDQLIAEKIGQETLLPSMQLGVEDPGANSSNCGEGYSCAYTNSISWSTPTKPLPMEINPQVVFERLFGDGGTAEERAARRQQDRSILDSITKTLARFKVRIGAEDRVRVDEYLGDVREIERRLQIAAKASTEVPTTTPYGVPESFDEHIKLQFDLLALAFRADITRVSTLLYARDLTARVYPESGTTISFHGGSHHAEDPKRIAEYAKLNRYHVAMLAYFIDKLRSTADGDGTLLDHSLILYGSNMGDSNQHLHYDVPHLLLGGASGKLKGGRHLAFPTRTVTTGNLLLSILDLFGVAQDRVGDSTGKLVNL